MPEVRLIDANALKDSLCYPCDRSETGYTIEECRIRGCGMMAVIDNQPTINPEVRHGRWRLIDDFNCWRCTCCGEEWVLDEGNPSDNGMMFCPHCGARMDGGTQ